MNHEQGTCAATYSVVAAFCQSRLLPNLLRVALRDVKAEASQCYRRGELSFGRVTNFCETLMHHHSGKRVEFARTARV